jgi:hypothetical protein
MRKTLFLLLAGCLLLSATGVRACWRPITRDWHGDPDEYQATGMHDEGGAEMASSEWRNVELQKTREMIESRSGPKRHRTRRLSIKLPGRTFLLEK